MSFNPAKPSNTESPALFPAENRANMSRLQTMFGEDHQFNLSPADNDGFHKILHLIDQGPGTIDPGVADPTVTAPDNTGEPAIAWEQTDVYGNNIPWFRRANAGVMTSMLGFNEIHRDGFTISSGAVLFDTPPDNTYGEIYWWVNGSGTTLYGLLSGKGFYVKSGGVCGAYAESPSPTIAIGNNPNSGLAIYSDSLLGAANLYAAFPSGITQIVNFRILYRYI